MIDTLTTDHFTCIPSFRHSTPSSDGQFIANVSKSCVLIRSGADQEAVQCFENDKSFQGVYRFARWYIQEKSGASQRGEILWRFLLADDSYLHTYDSNGAQRHIQISNLVGHGGGIADVQFGFTEDRVLLFSEFGLKMILLNLSNQKGLELRDPKRIPVCYGLRPQTGHIALLTRPSLHDILLCLQPDGSGPVMRIELATVDAQGIQWSPNGQWLAIWDTASAGYRVLILTADGHLFRTYYGGHDSDNIGLGVKGLRWSPTGEFLAVGDFDHQVILLKKNTFVPVASFHHLTPVCLPEVLTWEEQINASGHRSYAPISLPICPPSGSSADEGSLGVSILEFNIDGTLLATKCDSMPSTVWIWDTQRATPEAVLVHHSPVKSIQWHPRIPDELLIHCNIPQAAVHVWKITWKAPRVLRFPLKKLGGRMEAAWLDARAANRSTVMLGNAQNYAIIHIDHEGELILSPNKELPDLSLGEIYDENISGNSAPTIAYDDDTRLSNSGSSKQEEIYDTFDYRRHLKPS